MVNNMARSLDYDSIYAFLPPSPGIYALVISIHTTQTVTVGRLGDIVFKKGIYVYAGSAKGSGGLKARLARHLSRTKRIRWHIDYLLLQKDVNISAIAYITTYIEPECIIIRRLVKIGFEAYPIGFGSSDCKHNCSSHLVKCVKNDNTCLKNIIDTLRQLGFNIVILEKEIRS